MMPRRLLLLAAVWLAGCAAPVPIAFPYYYCVPVRLTLKDGSQTDALECLPRAGQIPVREGAEGLPLRVR